MCIYECNSARERQATRWGSGSDHQTTSKVQPCRVQSEKEKQIQPCRVQSEKEKNIFAPLVPCINHTSALSLETKQNTHQHPKPNNKTQEVNRWYNSVDFLGQCSLYKLIILIEQYSRATICSANGTCLENNKDSKKTCMNTKRCRVNGPYKKIAATAKSVPYE